MKSMAKLKDRSFTSESSIFADDKLKPRKVFVPSMEQKSCNTTIGLLLGWEYGRKWLEERNQFVNENTGIPKRRYIQPDFQWWIRKRNTVLDRRRLFAMRHQPAQITKKKTLSAFALSKEMRLLNKQKQLRTLTTNSTDEKGSNEDLGHRKSTSIAYAEASWGGPSSGRNSRGI